MVQGGAALPPPPLRNLSKTPVRPIWEILHLLFHTCLDYVSITLYNLYK